MRAEGLFLNFTTSEITTIQTKAKTLLTEGKTLMAYSIGGRINADIFAVKRDKICLILRLLERTEMIRRRKINKHTVITLLNWSKCQVDEKVRRHNRDATQTGEKKGKEREEETTFPEELDTPDFREAWAEWLCVPTGVEEEADQVDHHSAVGQLGEDGRGRGDRLH